MGRKDFRSSSGERHLTASFLWDLEWIPKVQASASAPRRQHPRPEVSRIPDAIARLDFSRHVCEQEREGSQFKVFDRELPFACRMVIRPAILESNE